MRQRLDEIRARIASACARSGRNSAEVAILAVSKKQPVELIEEAYSLGLRDFGENYIQELVQKREKLSHLSGIRWHLIGHLQSNKAKLAVTNADVFHALDSARLARELGRKLDGLPAREGKRWPVYIQVNVDLEASKSGVKPDELSSLVGAVTAEKSLVLEGLMCIPEPKDQAVQMRAAFRRLADLAAQVSPSRNLKLSMGMSDDFEVAVEEGANWIRLGRILFGERPAPTKK